MKSPLRFAAAGVALLAALAPPAPARPPAEVGDGPARAERPGAGYVVGIEDVLRVVVWGEPELSLTVRVRPDGKVTLPLIDDIEVAGLEPAAIRDVIAGRLTAYVREPSVTVIVEQINSFRVYFLGEVGNQGALQFYRPTRLLQAIAAAGGLTEFSKKEITLLRQAPGGEQRIPIDYKRLIAGGAGQQNIFLMPGDTLLFH